MVAKLWKLTLFMNDGSERLIALYDDEGEAIIDALELSEDNRVFGYRIKPVKREVNKKCKNTA